MNLLIDLGNSRIKWAQATPHSWETHAALLPPRDLSPLLDEKWGMLPSPQQVLAASVVDGRRYQELERWIDAHWARPVQRVRAEREFLGVKNHYRDPGSLGADRWAALIAARNLCRAAACVISCGTAVTIDALSAEGEFLGGVILPGLRIQRMGLMEATAGIREIAGDDTSCLARSTADGVAAGTLFGLVGAVERVLAEQTARLGTMEILITGADASLVMARTKLAVREVPDLVLRGLALIAQHKP